MLTCTFTLWSPKGGKLKLPVPIVHVTIRPSDDLDIGVELESSENGLARLCRYLLNRILDFARADKTAMRFLGGI